MLVSKVLCDVCGSESGIPDKPSTWGAQGKVEIRFGASYYLASSHVDLCKRCYQEMQDQLRDWLQSMPPCFRGVKAKTPAELGREAEADRTKVKQLPPNPPYGETLNIGKEVMQIFDGVLKAQGERND